MGRKITKPNAESSFLKDALECAARGWSIIPIKHQSPKGKEPACRKVLPYTVEPPDKKTLRRWFRRTDLDGLAVLCGKVSGNLVCRDFDNEDAYHRWAADHPDLAKRLPTARTGRGFHVYFRNGFAKILKLGDGELRGNGYCLLPPSRHPSGAVYKWVNPLPGGPLPEIDPFRVGLAHVETERTEENGDNRSNNQSSIPEVSLSSLPPDVQEQVQQAIKSTLPWGKGRRNVWVFEFCRALKAIPSLADAPAQALRPIVKQWHKAALPFIGTKPFEDTWFDFTYGWPRVKFPRGSELMAKIMAKADAASLPAVAADYDAPETHRLIKLCRELQRESGKGPFFLSCRTAGVLLGLGHWTAWRRMCVLQEDGVIRCVQPGKTRAARYRYIAEDVAPAQED